MIITLLSLIFGSLLLLMIPRRHRTMRRAECIRRISIYVSVGYDFGAFSLQNIASSTNIVLLAEAVAYVSERVCGTAVDSLREIMIYYDLERKLLARAVRSRGAERAYMLALLARMPLGKEVSEIIEARFGEDADRQVQFYAMMCAVAGDRDFVGHISAFKPRLTRYEMAELVTLLCRDMCAVAYTPLVRSQNYNLCMLGISVVRRMDAVEAERELRRLVVEGAGTLRLEAVYVLVSLRGNISGVSLRRWICNSPRSQRRSLCRHFVRSGYSIRTLRALFGVEECNEAERMLNTYKCRIA